MQSEKRTRSGQSPSTSAMIESNLDNNVQTEKRKRGRPKKTSEQVYVADTEENRLTECHTQTIKRGPGRPKKVFSSQISSKVIQNSVSRSVMNSPEVGSQGILSNCIRTSEQVYVVDTEENRLTECHIPTINDGNLSPDNTINTPDVTIIDMIPSTLPGSSHFTCNDSSMSPKKEIRPFSRFSCNKYDKKSGCHRLNKYDIKHSHRNWSVTTNNALSKPEKESCLSTLVIRKHLKRLKDEKYQTERLFKHSTSEETVSSMDESFSDSISQQTDCSFSKSSELNDSCKKCKDNSCADDNGSSRTNTISEKVKNKSFSNSEASISTQVKDKPTKSVKLKNSLKVSLCLLSADLIEKYGISEEHSVSRSHTCAGAKNVEVTEKLKNDDRIQGDVSSKTKQFSNTLTLNQECAGKALVNAPFMSKKQECIRLTATSLNRNEKSSPFLDKEDATSMNRKEISSPFLDIDDISDTSINKKGLSSPSCGGKIRIDLPVSAKSKQKPNKQDNKLQKRPYRKKLSSIDTVEMSESQESEPDVKSKRKKLKSVQKICDNAVNDAESVTETQSDEPCLKELTDNREELSNSKSNSGGEDQSEVTVAKGIYKIRIKYSKDKANKKDKSSPCKKLKQVKVVNERAAKKTTTKKKFIKEEKVTLICNEELINLQVEDHNCVTENNQVQVTYCEENDIIKKNHVQIPKVVAASPEKIALLKKQLKLIPKKGAASPDKMKMLKNQLEMQRCRSSRSKTLGKLLDKKLFENSNFKLTGHCDEIVEKVCDQFVVEKLVYLEDDNDIMHRVDGKGDNVKVNINSLYSNEEDINHSMNISDSHLTTSDNKSSKVNPGDGNFISDVFNAGFQVESVEIDDDALVNLTVPEGDVGAIGLLENSDPCDISSVIEVLSPKSVKDSVIIKTVPESVVLASGFHENNGISDISSVIKVFSPQSVIDSVIVTSALEAGFQFESVEKDDNSASASDGPYDVVEENSFYESNQIINRPFMIEDLKSIIDSSIIPNMPVSGTDEGNRHSKEVLNENENLQDEVTDSHADGLIDTAGQTAEAISKTTFDLSQTEIVGSTLSGESTCEPDDTVKEDMKTKPFDEDVIKSSGVHPLNDIDMKGKEDVVVIEFGNVPEMELRKDVTCDDDTEVCIKRLSSEVNSVIVPDNTTAYTVVMDTVGVQSESPLKRKDMTCDDDTEVCIKRLSSEVNSVIVPDNTTAAYTVVMDTVGVQSESPLKRKDMTCDDDTEVCIKRLSSEVNSVIVPDNTIAAYTVVMDTVGVQSESPLKNDVCLVNAIHLTPQLNIGQRTNYRNGFCSSNLLQLYPLGSYDEPDSAKDQMISTKHTDDLGLSPFNSSGTDGYQLSVMDTLYAGDNIESHQSLDGQLGITNEGVNSVIAMPVNYPESQVPYNDKLLADETKRPYILQSSNKTDKVNNDIVMHQCSVCNRRYRSLAKLLVHAKDHSHESPFELDLNQNKHQVTKTVERKDKYLTMRNLLCKNSVNENETDLENTDENVFETQSLLTEPVEEIVLTSNNDISGVKSFQTEMESCSIKKLKDKKTQIKKKKTKVVDSETVEVLNIDPANDTAMTCPVCRDQLNKEDFVLHKLVCESDLHSTNSSLTKSYYIDSNMSLASEPLFTDSDTQSDMSRASRSGLKVVLRKVKMTNTIVDGESLKFCGTISNPVWKIKERKKIKTHPDGMLNVKCSPAESIQVKDAFDRVPKSDTQIQCDKSRNEGHRTTKQVTVKKVSQGSIGSQEDSPITAITDFEKELLVNDHLKEKEKLKRKPRTKHDKSSSKKDKESKVTKKPKLRLDQTNPVNGEAAKHFMRSKMARKIYQRDKERQSFICEDGLPDFSKTGAKLDSLTHLVVGQSLTEINNNERRCKTKEDSSSKVTKPSKKSLKELKESVESLGILQKTITETDWTNEPTGNFSKKGSQKRTYGNVDSSPTFQFYKIPKLDFSGTNSNSFRTASKFSVSDRKLSPATGCNTESPSFSAFSSNNSETSSTDNDRATLTEYLHTSYEPVGSSTPSAQVYSYGGFNCTKTKDGASYYSFQDQWPSFGVDPSHEMSLESSGYRSVSNPRTESVFSSTPFEGHKRTDGEHSAELLDISQLSGINEKQTAPVKRQKLKRFVIEDEDKRVVVKRDHTNADDGIEIASKNLANKKDTDAEDSWRRKKSFHKSISMSTEESSQGSTENQTNEDSAYLGLKKTFENLCQDIEETVNDQSDHDTVVADASVVHSIHTEFGSGLHELHFKNEADASVGQSIHTEFGSGLQMDELHVKNGADASVGLGHSIHTEFVTGLDELHFENGADASGGHSIYTEFGSGLQMDEFHVENGAKEDLMDLYVDELLEDDLNMEEDQSDDTNEESTFKDVTVKEVWRDTGNINNTVKLNAGHRVFENEDNKSEIQAHRSVIEDIIENKHDLDNSSIQQHCKNDNLDGDKYFSSLSRENDDIEKTILENNHQNVYGHVETLDTENEKRNLDLQNNESDIDNKKSESQPNDSAIANPDSDNDDSRSDDHNDSDNPVSDNDSDNCTDENDSVSKESDNYNSNSETNDRSPEHDTDDDTDTNSKPNPMEEMTEEKKSQKSDNIELTEFTDDVLFLYDSDMDMFEDEEEEEARPSSIEPSASEKGPVTESGRNGNGSPEPAEQTSSDRDSKEREDITEGENMTKWEGTRRLRWMPRGYCFHFVRKGRCDKVPCTYQHSLPSQNVLLQSFKEYMDRNDSEICLDILRSHINIHGKIAKPHLEILYRRLSTNVECFWLLKIMNDRGMLDQIMIDNYIRTFASPQYSHYLYAVFEMAKGINIQFQKDVIAILLRIFSTQDQVLDKLIAVMLYSTEDENFVVPLDCLNVAVDGAIRVPRFFNQLLPWLLESKQLQRLNKGLKDRLNNALDGSPLSKETISKLRELLKQVNHVGETSQSHSKEQHLEEVDSWSEEDEQLWINNVKSVKYSKDIVYLASLYDEKRSINIPFSTEECCLYVEVIGADIKEAASRLNDFFKSVLTANSYSSVRESLIMLKKQLVMIAFGVFELCYMSKLIPSCIGILNAMRNHSLSPCTINKFLMGAVHACFQAGQSKFAVDILKGANFDTLDVRQQTELIGYFHIIVEQLGAQNLLIDCLCVVQWAFKLIYSGEPNVIDRERLIDLPEMCSSLIDAFLDQKHLNLAVNVYRLIQQFGQSFATIVSLELKLMNCLTESEYKSVAVSVFEKLKKLNVYGQQVFSTPRKIQIPCRTYPNISSEVVLLVEDYLMRLYNILCDEVMANKKLDPKDLHLKLVILWTIDQTRLLQVAKMVLETKLNPPLHSTMDYGCLVIKPDSLQNYLNELDKKGRCQGLTFKNKPGPRWFKQQQLNRR